MGALAPTHSEEEVLERTTFVEQRPEMSEAEYQAAEYQAWGRPQRQAAEEGEGHAPEGDGHDHQH